MEIAKLLKGHDLFASFSDAELKIIAGALHSKKIPAGEDIILEGDEGVSLFILESGQVEVSKNTLSGQKPTLSTFGPGAVFGEMGMIDEHIRTAGVTAKSDVQLWELSYQSLENISAGVPSIGAKMYKIVAKSLSQKIKATTSELLNVIQSARMAAVGEMSGSVVHEINSPMTVIQLQAESIQKEAKDGHPELVKIERSAEKIVDMVKRIGLIIHSVKTLSRDASADPFEPANVMLMIQQTFELCRARMRDLSIRLEAKISDPTLEWSCRSVQISQVILNLINNSVDAIQSQKEPWIEVEAKAVGDRLEISIVDSGNGIPEKERAKIFQSFYTTKKLGSGTGLGLSIAARIIALHKGSIQVDGNSKNTRFVISLPKL